MVLIILLAAELCGAIAWSILEGRFTRPRTVQALLKDASNVRGRTDDDGLQSGYRAPHRIIHPFVGYENPNNPIETFDLPREKNADELCVLIVGGSVAEQLKDMEKQMKAMLANETGKAVHIINVAVGGYKQPQQLNALSYLITLGYTCDIVVNLDGFNEYDLVFDNAEEGKNPWYPYKRLWSSPVGELRDMRAGAYAWEMIELQQKREHAAAFLHATPFGRSYVLTFLWRAWDRGQLTHMESLRVQIEEQQSQAAYNLAADGPEFDDDPDVLMRKSADLWSKSSKLMYEIAQSEGMQYIHFLQPNQYVPGSKPQMGATETRIAMGEPRHTAVIPQIYPLFIEAGNRLRTQGINFIDLTQIFANTAEQVYRDLDTHVSPLGNEILSGEIVQQIQILQLSD